jgi:putative PIN family toxin of toxin-antitoxin system
MKYSFRHQELLHFRFESAQLIIVSALLFDNSIPQKALDLANHHSTILFSAVTITELETVLERRKFDKYVSLKIRQEFLSELISSGQIVEIQTQVVICRDPKDNKFLELAADGQADYLITGDRDLLTLGSFRKTEILTPAQFLGKNIN